MHLCPSFFKIVWICRNPLEKQKLKTSLLHLNKRNGEKKMEFKREKNKGMSNCGVAVTLAHCHTQWKVGIQPL